MAHLFTSPSRKGPCYLRVGFSFEQRYVMTQCVFVVYQWPPWALHNLGSPAMNKSSNSHCLATLPFTAHPTLNRVCPQAGTQTSSSSDVEVLLAIQPSRQTTPALWEASLNPKAGQLLLQTAHTESYWGISTHIFNFVFPCTLILGWIAIPFSRGSSQSRDRTHVSCITSRFFYCPIHQASSEWKLTETKPTTIL